jgi:hypothetical protein
MRNGESGTGGGSARPGAGDQLLEAVTCLVEGSARRQVAAERPVAMKRSCTPSARSGTLIRLDEAARRILREVAASSARASASLFVLDPDRNVLRLVAERGMVTSEVDPIEAR